MSVRNAFSLVAASLLLFAASPALAQSGAPQQVPIQGYLTDAEGVPIDGDVELTVKVYNADDMVLHEETLQVTADAGSFTAYLGSNTPVDLTIFRDNSQLELGFSVDGGQEMEPRIPLGTAPYAGYAEHANQAASATEAETAETATEAENAQKLAGESPDSYAQPEWGDIQNVPDSAKTSYSAEAPVEIDSNDTIGLQSSCADGEVLKWDGSSWACAADDSGAEYSGTAGVEVDNSNETVGLTSSCSADQVLKYTDGSWSCAADADTEYMAGDGLNRTSNQFSVDTSTIQSRVTGGCPNAGSYIVGINQDGTAMCDSGITEVNAGTGLAGGGSSGSVDLRIPSGGISSNEIGSDEVGTSELAPDAVTSTELDDNSVDSASVQTDAVTSTEIDDGTIQNADVASNANIAPGKIENTAATLNNGANFSGTVSADDFSYDTTKTVKRTVGVPEMRIQRESEGDGWDVDYAGRGTLDTPNDDLKVLLVSTLDDIPAGATLKSFTVYYEDDDSAENITIDFDVRIPSMTDGSGWDTTVINDMNFTTSGSNSDTQTNSASLNDTTIAEDDTVVLDLQYEQSADTFGLYLYGVSVTYTVDSPAP